MISVEQVSQFLKKHWNDLIPLLLVPSAVSLLYANPWIFGAIALALGLVLVLIIVLAKKSHRHRKLLVFAISIVLISVPFIIYSDLITPILLDNIYKLTLNPRDRLNGQTLAVVKDSQTLWPIKLSRTNRIINITEEAQTELSELFSSSERGQLFFLTGPAGTGKSPLLKQWAHRLLKKQEFGNIFLISLTSVDRNFLSRKPSLSELVAHVYRGVISSSDYYDLLFNSKPCLIVLDDLDEIETDDANNLLKASNDLVQSTSSKVIIGSRPESVFLSHYYRTDLRFLQRVIVLAIEPLDDQQREYLIKSRVTSPNSGDDSSKVLKLLELKPAVREMATQLDHLNEIIHHIDEYAIKSDFEIMDALVEARRQRNIGSHWQRAGIDPIERIKDLSRIALVMSRENQDGSTNDKLRFAGYTTVIGDKYQFSPRILQSYFAIKGLQQNPAIQPADEHLSETLLKDLASFQAIDSNLVEIVKRSFKQNPLQYQRSIDQVRKITGDTFVLDTLGESGLSPRDLISNFILVGHK